MRRLLLAAAIAASMALGAVDASAQVKMRPAYTPKIMKGPVIKTPQIRVIPPSLALNRALRLAPNAKALGVKRQGSLYIVRLRVGNDVRQIHVDAVTGVASQ